MMCLKYKRQQQPKIRNIKNTPKAGGHEKAILGI